MQLEKNVQANYYIKPPLTVTQSVILSRLKWSDGDKDENIHLPFIINPFQPAATLPLPRW